MVSGAPIYLRVSASFSHEADRIVPTDIVIWMFDSQWRADACSGVHGIGSQWQTDLAGAITGDVTTPQEVNLGRPI
jgi:hypothetical protein